MGFLFGSSPSVSNFVPTVVNTLDSSQQTAESNLINALTTANGNPFGTYSGPLTAGPSQLQSTSLDALQNLVNPAAQAAQSVAPAQKTAIDTLTNVQNSTPQDLTGYYQTNVLQPLQDTFQNVTLPSIVSALGGSEGGPQSTAAVQGVTQAAKNFGNTLAGTQGNLALNTAQLNTSNKLAAAGQTPSVTAAPQNTLNTTLTAGGIPQELAQQSLTAQNQQQQLQNTNQQQQLADLLQLLGTKTTTTSTPVVNPGQSGLLTSALGGLAGNSGFGSSLGSYLFG